MTLERITIDSFLTTLLHADHICAGHCRTKSGFHGALCFWKSL